MPELLAEHTTLRVGGPARSWVEPESEAELIEAVRTADEAGEKPVPGQADSAPHNPMLLRKLAWTTVIATALFALFLANYVAGWVQLEDIPGWADRGPYRPG